MYPAPSFDFRFKECRHAHHAEEENTHKNTVSFPNQSLKILLLDFRRSDFAPHPNPHPETDYLEAPVAQQKSFC